MRWHQRARLYAGVRYLMSQGRNLGDGARQRRHAADILMLPTVASAASALGLFGSGEFAQPVRFLPGVAARLAFQATGVPAR
jgi:hypothetical protein